MNKAKWVIASLWLASASAWAVDYILHVPANGTPWVEKFPVIVTAPTPAPAVTPSPSPSPSTTPTPSPSVTPAPVPAGLPTNSVIAASCSYSAVQSAVSSAATNTRVDIPAGDCNWGVSSLSVPAGIYLKGAGSGTTILRRGGSTIASNSMIRFQCATTAPIALSDIELVGLGTIGTDDMGVRVENGCVQNFRIFNNKISKFTFAAIFINGEGTNNLPKGVIYNNEIFNNYTLGRGTYGYGVSIGANGQQGTLALGTGDAVFVENNVFYGNRHSVTSNYGGRFVARYNTLTQTDVTKNWGQIDAHGYTGIIGYGTFSWEIYNNNFVSNITAGGSGWAMLLRGGNGVVANNVIPSALSLGLTTENDCASGVYPVFSQTTSAYFSANSPNNIVKKYPTDAACASYLQLNRDYFYAARPSYTPYTYPHPLRN
jgi:hypothetical protein